MWTTLWDKIQAEPQAFGEMIRIWMLVFSAAGMYTMDDKLEKLIMLGISVTITFFTRKATTANVHVKEIRSTAFDRGIAEGVKQTSSGAGGTSSGGTGGV